jgi:hypothetical protein
MINSGFIDSSVSKKCNYQIITRQSIKYTDSNTICRELKYIITDFESGISTFENLVDSLFLLIGTYDFNIICKVLLKNYPQSNLTHLDKIVSLLWTSPSITASYNNLLNLVCYVYPTLENKREVIKRISKLTYDSYHKIMDSTREFQFEEIYSQESLAVVCAYSWIFAENLENIPELWELLDNSIVFSYKLYHHITTQIEYFNVIISQFSDNPSYEYLLKELLKFQKEIRQIIQKFPNWILSLNMDPKECDHYRIYYNINVIVKEFKLGSIISPKFPMLNNVVGEDIFVAHDSLIQILPYVNPSTVNDINVDVVDIFLNVSEKVQSHHEILIHDNVIVMQHINHCLHNFKSYFESFFEHTSKHPLLNQWMHIYIDSLFHTLNLLSNSTSKIIDNFKNNDELSVGECSYYIVNIKKCYKIVLDSLRILKDINVIFDLVNIDVKYHYRNLLISIAKYLSVESLKKLISNTEIMALTIIIFDLIDLLSNNELIEFRNEHDLDVLNNLSVSLPDSLRDRLYNLKELTYPDEFLDPITDQVIVNPLQLPDTLQIIDQKVIYHILRNNPLNPFNMKPLTVEELDKYNQQPEIQTILSEFLNKKLKFINNH